MKIIHTSDLHLVDIGDERWDALLKICEKVRDEGAELLLIAGDLFDRKASSSKLRGEVRRVFSKLNAETILIPGNHDADAYEAGLDYSAKIAVSPDYPVSFGDTDIWGVPFQHNLDERKTAEYIFKISNKIRKNRVNVLLFHGELLDSFYSGADYGNEDKIRYMPVRLSLFKNSGFNYIVAGHFHSSYERYKIDNNKKSYFIYSGSPVSITSKEVGQRYIGMIDTESGKTYEIPIDTMYYENCELKLDPLDEKPPEKVVSEVLDSYPDHARVKLIIRGFINSRILGCSEHEIIKKIEKISSSKCFSMPEILLRDVGMIYENPLFVKIHNKLEELIKERKILPEESIEGSIKDNGGMFDLNRLRELLLRVFMEAEV